MENRKKSEYLTKKKDLDGRLAAIDSEWNKVKSEIATLTSKSQPVFQQRRQLFQKVAVEASMASVDKTRRTGLKAAMFQFLRPFHLSNQLCLFYYGGLVAVAGFVQHGLRYASLWELALLAFYCVRSAQAHQDQFLNVFKETYDLDDFKVLFIEGIDKGNHLPLIGFEWPQKESFSKPVHWDLADQEKAVKKTYFVLRDKSGRDRFIYRTKCSEMPAQHLIPAQEDYFMGENRGFLIQALANKATDSRPLILFSEKMADLYRRSREFESQHNQLRSALNEIEHGLLVQDTLEQGWAEIALPARVKDALWKRVHLFRENDPAAPTGMLLYGPPGTGKSLLARRVAELTEAHFMSLSLPDLKGGKIGQSGQKVKELWAEARTHSKCVIFIDECEGVFGQRGAKESDRFTVDIVQSFLPEWEGTKNRGQIWVIGASNRKELIDPAMISRFGVEIEIPLPEPAERAEILRLEFKKQGADFIVTDEVVQATQGLSGRDLAILARETKVEAVPNSPTAAHFMSVLGRTNKARVA